MIVITKHAVASEDFDEFAANAAAALAALARRPGYLKGSLARAVDEPELWTIVTEWEGPGFYRRALSNYDVRIAAVPLLSTARDEASTFEVVSRQPPVGD